MLGYKNTLETVDHPEPVPVYITDFIRSDYGFLIRLSNGMRGLLEDKSIAIAHMKAGIPMNHAKEPEWEEDLQAWAERQREHKRAILFKELWKSIHWFQPPESQETHHVQE